MFLPKLKSTALFFRSGEHLQQTTHRGIDRQMDRWTDGHPEIDLEFHANQEYMYLVKSAMLPSRCCKRCDKMAVPIILRG